MKIEWVDAFRANLSIRAMLGGKHEARVSITDHIDDLESAARFALVKTGAIKGCLIHSDVTIRVGDPDAERHAYALATTILKSDGSMWMREDLMPAIKDELDMAADGECPACEGLRDA